MSLSDDHALCALGVVRDDLSSCGWMESGGLLVNVSD